MLVSSRSTIVKSFPAFKERIKLEAFGDLTNAIMNGPEIGLGFNIRRIWSWIWFEIQILRSFKQIRRWQPNVIVVSSLSILTFLTGVILKWLLRVPLVVEVRDIYPLTLVEVGGFGKWNPAVIFLGWVEKLGYRNADAILSSLPNLAPHVRNRIGTSKPVVYLPMGYSPEFLEHSAPSEKALNSLDELARYKDAFSVGYCGSVGVANALLEPLQAFQSLAIDLPNVHFWIVGDGPLLSEYIQEFGSSPNIHFLGNHPKTDVPHLLKHFDVAINPWLDKPIYRFGISPNKWIDYMMAAKPILVPYSGYRFLIDEEEIGWFVPPCDPAAFRDAILRLNQLPSKELVRFGRNGKQYLESNLGYRKLAGKLEALLKQVVVDNPDNSLSGG